MNILFIASGRRVSLLQNFQKEKEKEDKLICCDSSPLVPTRSFCNKFYLIPEWKYKESFITSIKQIHKEEKIDLIISLMDPATELLVKTNLPLLSSNQNFNNIAGNKINTIQFFQKCGVKVPSPGQHFSKTIAREIKGYGSRNIHILTSLLDWNLFESKFDSSNFVFNEYIENAKEYTVDCFKDLDNNTICVIPRLRLEVRHGEVQKGQTVNNKKLINLVSEKILPNLSFTGPICIQVLEKDEEFFFIEINDRFGGGTPLSIAAGANIPKWIIDMYKNKKIEVLNYFTEVQMLRYDKEIFYAEPGIIFE
jgi:carbamoyl-phosphate synthase large subunit